MNAFQGRTVWRPHTGSRFPLFPPCRRRAYVRPRFNFTDAHVVTAVIPQNRPFSPSVTREYTLVFYLLSVPMVFHQKTDNTGRGNGAGRSERDFRTFRKYFASRTNVQKLFDKSHISSIEWLPQSHVISTSVIEKRQGEENKML